MQRRRAFTIGRVVIQEIKSKSKTDEKGNGQSRINKSTVICNKGKRKEGVWKKEEGKNNLKGNKKNQGKLCVCTGTRGGIPVNLKHAHEGGIRNCKTALLTFKYTLPEVSGKVISINRQICYLI
jgi:hypothetical protein